MRIEILEKTNEVLDLLDSFELENRDELEEMLLSLLEAMSYGNCCLTSDIPECATVLEDKGVTFKKSDVKDLKNKLQELCTNEKKVKKYKSEAQKYILDKYNWDDVVEKTLELYKK